MLKKLYKNPTAGTGSLQYAAAMKAAAGQTKQKNNTAAGFPDDGVVFSLEAPPGIEPGMKVLQTSALPLGYDAI